MRLWAKSVGVGLAVLAITTSAAAKPAKPAHHAHTPAAKKKPAPAAAPAKTVTPLTAESLGLDEKLSSIKASESGAAAPAPAPAPPAAVAPAPEPVVVPVLTPIAKDKVIEPPSEPRRRLSIQVNPIPMVAGRYGGNIEFLPFRHHALVASAFYQTFTETTLKVIMPSEVDVSRGAPAKLGGEFGYRFYSGRNGPHGLFAGISGVAMPIALPRLTQDFKSEVVSLYALGGAFDVGVQAVTSWGFTIGGGIGAMYLAYDRPASATPPPGAPTVKVTEPHFLPRLLLAAGWSF